MEKLTGHCTCGNVGFNYSGELGPAAYCHCDDCRRTTGSAFNVSLQLQIKSLQFSGKEYIKEREYIADSGNAIVRAFCSNCGSPIYTIHPHEPDYIWIKAGIVDQTELIKPVHESWTDTKVAWAIITAQSSSKGNFAMPGN
ncbi:MAG: GFA family protein [Chitinivibrionales bacterium]|nr:GFA family protein [Chitinivibrionales bacterium]